MGFQDSRDRGSADSMPEVLERALDPRVATSYSPEPSARPTAGFRGGRYAGRAFSRTSTSARSTDDAMAGACPASRWWRFHVRPHGLRGGPEPPVGGDRHPSDAGDDSQAVDAGVDVLRRGTDGLALPSQPANEHAQHYLRRGGVDHGAELISRRRPKDVGQALGHYGRRNATNLLFSWGQFGGRRRFLSGSRVLSGADLQGNLQFPKVSKRV
jgi:hypothetical protein